MSIKLVVLVITVVLMDYYGCVFVFVWGDDDKVIRCIEREREALVRLKQEGLKDRYGVLSSWGTQHDDCCKWYRIECSNTTGHVIALRLQGIPYPVGGNITPALLDLHHLKILDLSQNYFSMREIPKFIGSMKRLQRLYLVGCLFSGMIPPEIGNLTNLKTLNLAGNLFTGTVPSEIANLTNLRELYLGYDLQFESLDWLSRLPLLSRLDLRYSVISDTNWIRHVMTLHSLEELYLSLTGIPDVTPDDFVFVNSTSLSLSVLDLSDNDLTSDTVDFLFRSALVRTSLLRSYLDGNQLTRLPASLGEFSELGVLDVASNSLQGSITEANFTELHRLKELDLSFNSLSIRISPGWTPPFQLDSLGLAGLNMGPHLPTWIRTQNRLVWLDLSSTGLSDDMVPTWFWSLSPGLEYLNISHNQISGVIPQYFSQKLLVLDVSVNNFSGPIPLLHPNTKIFQLSQNMFSGSISSVCTTTSNTQLLDLSDNQLSGEIPNCWENMTSLAMLNLANNNFSGEIPHSFGSLSKLRVLHLRNNSLSGELPSTLKNCRSLVLVDIGRNEFRGSVPSWIGASYYTSMKHLILKDNRFYGTIPPEICSLTHIQVLDLSENSLSGHIPQCFDNFTMLLQKNTANRSISGGFTGYNGRSFVITNYIDYALVQWKGVESEYRRNLRFLKLIDLSSNRLVGRIPETFSSLKGLISLNLSRNGLSGDIDPNIGNMEMLESLDMSRNQLSGPIPIGLGELHFLAILDLAYNNLSGKIPSAMQLQNFDASVYAGNRQLCGRPLALCPGDSPVPDINDQEQHIEDEEDDGFMGLSVWQVGISITFGFIVGFWGFVGPLLVKKSWRIAYFHFWDGVGDWLCVTTTILFRKFRPR